MMPGRSNSSGSQYRYGINGKEQDKEVVQYDYGFRIYDPRLVRFKSVDPLVKSYPWYTPYQFAGNSPIRNVDLDGAEPKSVINELGQLTIPVIGFISKALDIEEHVLENTTWFIGNGNVHWEWAQPNAITIGNKIYYSQAEADKNDNADVPYWVGLVGHEESHRQDYDEQGFYGFLSKYKSDYDDNKKAGQSDYTAYRNIESEKKAYGNQAFLESFFNNTSNAKSFNDILNNQAYGQLEKSDRLKVLGIEKIAIPKIEDKIKQITNTLNNIDPKKDFLGQQRLLIQLALDSYNKELSDKKNEVSQLKEKITKGNYQSLPGDN